MDTVPDSTRSGPQNIVATPQAAVDEVEAFFDSLNTPAKCAPNAHSEPDPGAPADPEDETPGEPVAQLLAPTDVEHPDWSKLRSSCPLWGKSLVDLDEKLEEAMHLRRRTSEDQIVVDLLAWASIYKAAALSRSGRSIEEKSGYGRSRLALSVRMLDAVTANGGRIPAEWLGLGTRKIEKLLSKPKVERTTRADKTASTLLRWVRPPKSAGIIPSGNHEPRLDPAAWSRDIEDVDSAEELATEGALALAAMLVKALTCLRDRGDADAVRATGYGVLRDVGALLHDIGGDPAVV